MLLCKECFDESKSFICSSDADFPAFVSNVCDMCGHKEVICFRLADNQIFTFGLLKAYLYQTGHIKSD